MSFRILQLVIARRSHMPRPDSRHPQLSKHKVTRPTFSVSIHPFWYSFANLFSRGSIQRFTSPLILASTVRYCQGLHSGALMKPNGHSAY